jgi:hypothetical protein
MTFDKRTVVLGVTAAAAVAAAATATAINHRSSGSKQRRQVTAYIDSVNAIENQMHRPLTRVMLAYRDFTRSKLTRRETVPELAAAAQTLARLDRRLAALSAPPEAKKLRAGLVRMVGEQAAVTREVRRLAAFSPGYAALLRSAQAASAQLGVALRTVKIPTPHRIRGTKKQILAAQAQYRADSSAAAAKQADAVDAYDRRVAAIVRRLRKLQPPAALAPTYRAQLHGLQDAASAGSRLANELRKPGRAGVPALGRQFTLASREAQTLTAQRAEIAAVRAYNTRARAISSASAEVERELARLQATLP